LSIKLYSISFKRDKSKLLLRVTSIFILAHLIIFPLIYLSIINGDPESIDIDDKIVNNEKDIRLKEFQKSNNTDFQHKKKILNKILIDDKKLISNVSLNDIIDRKLLILNSNIIGSRYYDLPPGNQNNKIIIIYDKQGNQLFNFIVNYKIDGITSALEDYLTELTIKENSKAKELEIIESNSFWSYRRILPYTLNILFTENFNPKSQTSNFVYFIHNILVLGFLLSFIMTLLQNYITKNGTST
jgi:hypothetical protein